MNCKTITAEQWTVVVDDLVLTFTNLITGSIRYFSVPAELVPKEIEQNLQPIKTFDPETACSYITSMCSILYLERVPETTVVVNKEECVLLLSKDGIVVLDKTVGRHSSRIRFTTMEKTRKAFNTLVNSPKQKYTELVGILSGWFIVTANDKSYNGITGVIGD